MTGIPVGGLTTYGNGFTPESKILVDGVPLIQTVLMAPGELQGQTNVSLFATTAATHQITVQDGNNMSNAATLTVYSPQLGPQVMQATPSFLVTELTSPVVGGLPIVAADVNGDGLADVIMLGPTLPNSDTIAILDGRADGTLATAQYIPCPAPSVLAVADIDENGTPDLVAVTSNNSSTLTVDVLLGDGHGNFQAPVTAQTFPGIYARTALLADIDGDGNPDLVVAYEPVGGGVPDNLVWLRNTAGSFGSPVILTSNASDNGPFSIADFNHDGKPDILYTLPGSPESLHILFNQGNGQFSDQAVSGLNGVFGPATVLDFNLDGIPDLAIQVPLLSGITVLYSFKGNGNGSFTAVNNAPLGPSGITPYLLVTGDFDGDGFPDLAGSGGVGEPFETAYLFGDGQGNFVTQQVVGAQGAMAVGDFNGDGHPDIAMTDGSNFISLALGRTDRNFSSVLSLTPAIVGPVTIPPANGPYIVADMDSDGHPDIVALGQVLYGNGAYQFTAVATTDSFSAPYVVGDFNGDGKPDIAAGATTYLNSGSRSFKEVGSNNLPMVDGALAVVADFNGDGKDDVAVVVPGDTSIGIWYSRGDGTFYLADVLDSGAFVGAVFGGLAVGDLDGDGRPDIAAGLAQNHEIVLLFNTGQGQFTRAFVSSGGLTVNMIASDLNHNGKPDVVICNFQVNGSPANVDVVFHN